MSRRLFVATTLVVVCMTNEGVFAKQAKDGDGSGAAVAVIPTAVISFLSPPRPVLASVADFSGPIDLAGSSSNSIRWNLEAPQRAPSDQSSPAPTAELPLVPLPSPMRMGAAGLAGLAIIRIFRAAQKSHRSACQRFA